MYHRRVLLCTKASTRRTRLNPQARSDEAVANPPDASRGISTLSHNADAGVANRPARPGTPIRAHTRPHRLRIRSGLNSC
jgi:hypothetical protein